MCGVAGFTHVDRNVDRGVIERMTASLFHRGPDQQNVFVSPSVCLGAVRLKIVDLNGGNQPLVSSSGDTVLAFNGEIYNHKDLRLELQSLGHVFHSSCDTEVVLEAFLEWDTDCFRRLRGMFGLAIWCESEKRLLLARDRVGIKPLYYFKRGSEIHFGSELKAILEHPAIPRKLDQDALRDYLSLNYVPGPRTLIQGLLKLSPAHFLEHRFGCTTIQRYWEADPIPRTDWTLPGATAELDRLMTSAVQEQMVSDVPLGIWSSGGLDSSTVLHYASQSTSRRLQTFSIGFQSKCCDESQYFRAMAERYGTEHHEFQLQPGGDLLSAIEDFAYFSDEPGADAGALPVWFLSRLTAKHVTVALSGDGGDELFGGYLTYAADRAARPLRAVPAWLRERALGLVQQTLPVSSKKIGLEYKIKRLLEGSLLPADRAHLFWNGTFSDSQKRRLLRNPGESSLDRMFENLPPAGEMGSLNRYMILDQQYYLPDNILYKVDRMSMAHSIEVRPPFLDHRIVEFAASLPQGMKIRGLQKKLILNRLMEGKLPASVIDRPKKGFDIPTHDWFRGFLRPLLMDTVSRHAIQATGIFNFPATERLIRDHMERKINVGYHLWGLLTLFLWLKKWDVEACPVEDTSRAFSLPAFAATT